MKTFILIKRTLGNSNIILFEWWELFNNRLYNSGGGWNTLLSTDVILETVNAKNWNELLTKENIAKTTEYQTLLTDSTDSSLKIGWLAPDGTMHYCKYQNHISYVHIILNKDVPTLESQGWIHIVHGLTYLGSSKRITQAQAKTATEVLGLKVNDEDILYN